MKVLYVNPDINLHRLPFYMELRDILGEENVIYATVATEDFRRRGMGKIKGIEKLNIFVISNSNKDVLNRLFLESDVVLNSVRDYYDLMKKRLEDGKLTYYFSERWFKKPLGLLKVIHPKILRHVIRFRSLSKYPDFCYLPQGYMAAVDFLKVGINPRMFRFGYFTELSTIRQYSKPKGEIGILWCGRMLEVKRVDLLIKAFSKLITKHRDIHLTIVGEGPKRQSILSLLQKTCPSDTYSILGLVEASEVRKLMQNNDIFVFTSDGGEGWGAVVNEAMSENCAIISSDIVGSASFMFDKQTGLSFKSGDIADLIRKLDYLLSNPKEIEKQKFNSYNVINGLWSPKCAALRFVNLSSALLIHSSGDLYSDGPLSLLS